MELKIDEQVAARMGYPDVRATFVTVDGFTEVALLGPDSTFRTWSVVVHNGCDPDDPAAGSSQVNDYPDEATASEAFRSEVAAFSLPGDPAGIASRIRGCIAQGEAVPADLLEAAVTALEKTPTVFVSVYRGMADILAVDGTVSVYCVDLDREGEILTDEEIDGILSPDDMSGTGHDIDTAIGSARSVLEGFKEPPSP